MIECIASETLLHDKNSVSDLHKLIAKASIITRSEMSDDEDDDRTEIILTPVPNFESFVEDFAHISRSLLDLTPSLMDLEEFRLIPEKSENTHSAEMQAEYQSELPHDHFKRLLRDKYASTRPELVGRPAKECWNLYFSLKDGLIRRENMIKDRTSKDKDSPYESMF